MAITIIHGIQQNILHMVSFDKKVSLLLYLSFAIVSCCLYFQDYSTSIVQLMDSFYYLKCKLIVRNYKSTLKQLIYLHASLLIDGMLRQWRTRRTTA